MVEQDEKRVNYDGLIIGQKMLTHTLYFTYIIHNICRVENVRCDEKKKKINWMIKLSMNKLGFIVSSRKHIRLISFYCLGNFLPYNRYACLF